MHIEKAFAKINLSLHIKNKRINNYHNIESVMTCVDLYDELFFEVIDKGIILTCDNKSLMCDDSNLIIKVAKYMFEIYKIESGLKISLKKNIPIEGGMAGGSSDAAATIRGINKIFNLKLSYDEMIKIGIKFGSDIPFCINQETSLVKELGDEVSKVNDSMEYYVLVVVQDFGLSTKEMYESFNSFGVSNSNLLLDSIKNKNYSLFYKSLSNDFEELAFSKKEDLLVVKTRLEKFSVNKVMLSGSGPTMLGFFTEQGEALAAYEYLLGFYKCYLTKKI